jgi:hypothetical protein
MLFDIESQVEQTEQRAWKRVAKIVFCPTFECGHSRVVVPCLYPAALVMIGVVLWIAISYLTKL